tara:strand:+ start:91 stop:456 length:366 start_codon:yes stop_codon:yes gene_type:complete
MKSYKQFVVESNDARCNLDEGWAAFGSGLRALGRSAGRQWVKRPVDILTGIYGAQRVGQALTNPAGYDEPGMYLGLGQMMPMANPVSTTIKLGAMGIDAKRRYDSYMRRKKKEEERRNKNK